MRLQIEGALSKQQHRESTIVRECVHSYGIIVDHMCVLFDCIVVQLVGGRRGNMEDCQNERINLRNIRVECLMWVMSGAGVCV